MNNETDFLPSNYDVFAGLDVDKKSISVTFVDHGVLQKSMRIPYSSSNLVSYTRKHFDNKRIAFAYEAGPTGYGLYDELTNLGYPCLVVAASMIPTPPGQRVKNNRLDSKKIAETLRGGQLKSINVPSSCYRHLRHLVKLRDTYARQVAAFKCRIKALLLLEGIPFPEAPPNSQWSIRVLDELANLPLEKALRFKLGSLLSSLKFAHQKVLEAAKEMRHFCKEDEEINRCMQYLTSIPGVGQIVASHLLARIGDYRKLQNVRQIAAFLGMVPTEHSTGDSTNKGSITRLGDSRLRNKIIQAAWHASRIDPELRQFYLRIYARNPKNHAAGKAIVAVARKLTARIYAVLKEQRFYNVNTDLLSTSMLMSENKPGPQERLEASQNLEIVTVSRGSS